MPIIRKKQEILDIQSKIESKKDIDFRKNITKSNRAITLIALVITIIVLLILAGVTIAMLTGDNGILTKATKAQISTELSSYKEQLELYKTAKTAENMEFEPVSLTAGKENISYNTKSEEETGNIKTIMPDITNEYYEIVEVIKGELILNTTDKNMIKVAQSLGIEVNPYDIEDGVLLSSENNLLLMDETGTLTIPDSVTAIGEGAFSNLEGLKTIIIPSTVKRIEQNAFSNNTTLENVIIQVKDNEGVEYIGRRAFYGCSNLKDINLPDTITYIEAEAFRDNTKIESIKLPSKLKELKGQTFISCSNLKKIELSKDLESLGSESLLGTAITKLELPLNLQSIGNSALNISTLQEIDTSNNNYFEYKNGVLYTKDLKTLVVALSNITSINIEKSVESINGSAFRTCSKLETINIPDNVKNIGTLCFSNGVLKKIIVSSNNNYLKNDENNNLYSKDGTMLYRLFDTGNVIIQDGVQNIKGGALLNNGKISTITLPESYIGDKTTEWETFPKLDYLFIPKDVKSIDKQVYFNIKNIEVSTDNPYLKSINNEYIVSKDGTQLYWVKSDLAEVNIPETVKQIKQWAFLYQETEEIKLPKSVTKIEEYTLRGSETKRIEIQSNIESISVEAFTGANNLKEVIIHKKKDEIAGLPWGNPYGDKAIIWDN